MTTFLRIAVCLALPLFGRSQSTDFTYANANSNNCLPIDIQFTQTSSGTPRGYLWDFGNGTRSNVANPVVTFEQAGYYTVKLVTVYDNSTAQKTRSVFINPSVNANFSADRTQMCMPGTVVFTVNASGNINNYRWNFGDNTPEVLTNDNTVSHAFTQYGNFTVTLNAGSASGCSATQTANINVERPSLIGTISSPVLGCVPVTNTFNVDVNLASGSVTNYTWNFGNGQTQTTASGQISHTFSQAGNFVPTVAITTTEGCSGTFSFDSIGFGVPPQNLIAYPVDTVYCGSDPARFVSSASNANRYDWDFGGGTITSVTDTTVDHRYTSLGYKDVTVTPMYNGCAGSPVSFQITIIGVIAKYSYRNTCQDKKTFRFVNTSQGNLSTVNWTLGTGTSLNPDTVTHTFPTSAVSPTMLFISDNITGCVDSSKVDIYTANPVLENPDRTICINTETSFHVANNYQNPSLAYTWDVMGDHFGPTANGAPIRTSDSLGDFSARVILYNGSAYCRDTLYLDHPISVRGPLLDFTAPSQICMNTALTVINLSRAYQPSDTVRSWSWNFGRPQINDTAFQPAPYQYTVARTYKVKLTATDIHGCTDSLIKKVSVRPEPFLWIIPHTANVCEGQSTTLIGYTSDSISWTPAATNFCTTCDTTSVGPLQTTRFFATARNAFNCAATDSALVKVVNPFTAQALTTDTSMCEGGKISLDVAPQGKVVTWSPAGSLSNSGIYNPVASPTQSTVYSATLTDSAGCFTSTADVNVTIRPKPTVEAGANKALPYNTNFTLSPQYGSNVRGWTWTPADSLSCADCPFPTAISTTTKTYTVNVVSDSGCTATDALTVFVECNGASLLLPTAFTPNNDNLNDYYFPITRGIRSISKFSVFNRQGQMLYQQNNLQPNKDRIGWDGRFKGQLQEPGAYVCMLEAVCDMGQTLVQKGSFMLVR